MAIAYKAGNGAQGASVTPTWPSVAAGDVAVLAHAISASYSAPTTPSGFNLLTSSVVGTSVDISVRLTVWYKTCTGSETGNVVTFNDAGSSYEVASISVYSGVDGGVGASNTSVSGAATTSMDSAVVSSVVTGDRVVHIVAAEDTTADTTISTSGASPRQSLHSGTELASMLVADKDDSGAAVTFTQTVSASMAIISLALKSGAVATTAGSLISGVVPPTALDGAVGQYYIDTVHAVLHGPKASSSFGPAESITSATPVTNDTAGSNLTMGLRFYAVVAGRVTGLRFYRHSSASVTSRTFKLWSDAGSALATASTSGESGAGWHTATLGSPVALTAGTYYRIAYDVVSGQVWSKTISAPVSVNANFTTLSNHYGIGSASFPDQQDAPGEQHHADIIFEPTLASPWPVAMRGVATALTAPSSPSVGDVWVDRN